jgi:hypothetical protein
MQSSADDDWKNEQAANLHGSPLISKFYQRNLKTVKLCVGG